MYDKPTLAQLLDAVRQHLQEAVIPAVLEDRGLYFQTLVAINVLSIIERESMMSADHLKGEWQRLDFVQGSSTPIPPDPNDLRAALTERNRSLCEEIDGGRYDFTPRRAALFEHLLVTTRAQLEVANPKFLQALAIEDQNRLG